MKNFAVEPNVRRVMQLLIEAGAADVLLVGGCVRDVLLGVASKDVDIEVYGLTYDEIMNAVSPHFRVEIVGKSFGVMKVGHNIDIALPRTESKSGTGHTGFDVTSDPNLSPRAAFARRDYTINALGWRLDGTLIDYYGGRADLEKKILRATSKAFCDDPLRVLRGMQFAARFGMTMEPNTVQLCRDILPEFSTLSKERVYEEWLKWAEKGKYPSFGLDVLRQTRWIESFSELSALVSCEQNPCWHPEGDVWEHTKLVSNAMVEVMETACAGGEAFTLEERTVLMFAALAHDFGKPLVSVRDEGGVIRSHGHAEAGLPRAKSFLCSMRSPNAVVERVLPLVAEHMAILNTRKLGEPSARTIRRLAVRLFPANVRLWCALCQADAMGCFPPAADRRTIRFQADVWLQAACAAEVRNEKPKPILLGRHLAPLGVASGPRMGQILAAAYEAQLDGEFSDISGAIEFLRRERFL